jgi:hypothetical protein
MVAVKINEIKAAWSCNAHGHCFIDADSEHVQMNRFRLNSWATAMVSLFITLEASSNFTLD